MTFQGCRVDSMAYRKRSRSNHWRVGSRIERHSLAEYAFGRNLEANLGSFQWIWCWQDSRSERRHPRWLGILPCIGKRTKVLVTCPILLSQHTNFSVGSTYCPKLGIMAWIASPIRTTFPSAQLRKNSGALS